MRQFKDSVSSQFSQTSQKTTSIRVLHFNYYLLIKDLYRSTNLPMTKVSGPSNIFSINALLRNLALKHYSVWPNQYSHSIAFHSVVTTTNKLMAWPWVLKWDPATPIFLQVLSNIKCSQHHGPKPELYGRYIDDWIGATSFTKEELTQFITAVISFHPALKYT